MAKKSNDPKDQQEPILIHVDEFEVRKSLGKLQDIILPAVRKVKQEFERLRLGLISGTYLKDLLFDNMFNYGVRHRGCTTALRHPMVDTS